MDFDDIVIGSGLAALGTVLGLPAERRVLVAAGPAQASLGHYDGSARVPSFHLGLGGLGNHWHGVIPTGLQRNFAEATDRAFARLFAHFYSRTEVAARVGRPWLFVPWRPIRPRAEWARLVAQRTGRLTVRDLVVSRFEEIAGGVRVHGDFGTLSARRLWVAAGALHTPGLLDRSCGRRVSRETVSDHAIVYLGQLRGQEAPQIHWTRDGMFLAAHYPAGDRALCTLRPAHFEFAELDRGIEARSAFGLPTGRAIQKIFRGRSPGLLAEAVFNRTGLLARARVHSVYAQVVLKDAYALDPADQAIRPRTEVLQAGLREAHAACEWPGLVRTRRVDHYIPAIHLHHTLDLAALAAAGVGGPSSAVQVVDASVHDNIGCDHHSFKVMLAAGERARAAV